MNYKPKNFQFGEMITEEDLNNTQTVELIYIGEEIPSDMKNGDNYYDTTDNRIYTMIDDELNDGEEPVEGVLYILISEQNIYYYNGSTLISVGGGTEDILIQEEEPETDDWKIWIDKKAVDNLGSEVYVGSEEPENKRKVWVEASKNLLLLKNQTGNAYGADFSITNGIFKINGNVSNASFINQYFDKPIPARTKLTLSLNNAVANSGATVRLFSETDGNVITESVIEAKVINNHITFTTTKICSGITIRLGGGSSFSNFELKLMLNYGDYIPYEPQMVPSIKANINGTYETIVNKNVYSTGEVVIGTFLGKPLYRKVISGLNFGTSLNAWTNTGATISNVDTLVMARCLNTTQKIQAFMGIKINGNNIQYYTTTSFSGTNEIILEYTKTTD